MNLESFLDVVTPLDLLAAAPGTPLKIGRGRPAVEFGIQKEILTGTWDGSTLVFEALTPKGRELLTLLFGDVLLRRAVEREFTTGTRFHVKSALRFAGQASKDLPPPPPAPTPEEA